MVELKYNIGDIVFLITDSEQLERIITGYVVRPNSLIYYLSSGTTETSHYEIEIATIKNWNK